MATAVSASPAIAARDPQLVASLEARNATFSTLLSLIPQRYYQPPSDAEVDSRWMKKKKRKTGEEIKEHKKRARGEKLDPSNLPSATIDDEPSSSTAPAPALPPPISALPPAASITDLRARMHAKLDTFRKDRGADEAEAGSRDELEAARRQKRGEMRDRRRRERKETMREERRKRMEAGSKPAKTQLIVPDRPREDVTLPAVALPGRKQSAPLKKLSNPAQALAHLEKHNAKIAALPEDKRKEVEEKERWAKAEARAAGVKVADQETVLKKAVKREEKRKMKSGKEWNERKTDQERAQAARIKKKQDNVASRAETRRNKRLGIKDKKPAPKGGKGGKKGRPGFEGKSAERKKRVGPKA